MEEKNKKTKTKPKHFKAELQFSLIDNKNKAKENPFGANQQVARLIIEGDFETINRVVAKVNELEGIDLIRVVL